MLISRQIVLNYNNNNDFLCANITQDRAEWCDKTKGLSNCIAMRESSTDGAAIFSEG